MAARGAELQSQNPFSKENYYGKGGAGATKATPDCRSTLHIKATAGQLRWQVRFVVLDAATRALLCFKSEDAAASDSATVKKILFSRVQRWDGKPNGMELTTPLNRVYHLYADSGDVCDRWMHALESVLQTDASKGRARGASVADGHLAGAGTTPRLSIVPVGGAALVANDGAAATGAVSPAVSAVAAGSASDSTPSADLQREAEALRLEVATLKAQLAAVADGTDADGTVAVAEGASAATTSISTPPTPPTKAKGRRQRGSMLPDGSHVDVTQNELSIMRSVFELFDERKTGRIQAADVERLHAKLGEPISAEEAADAVKFMAAAERRASMAMGRSEAGGAGNSVDFHSFVKWWNYEHRPDAKGSRKGARYAAKFKFLKAHIANPEIGKIITRGEGSFPSFEFRITYHLREVDAATGQETITQISPWHDVPLNNPDGSYNFICEIPKWTRRKMEIAPGEEFNPIKQDTKNGKLREYKWGDMMFNYGAMPQTWEDPAHVTEPLGTAGDNDPIDVVEIGVKQWPMGSIVRVKVLGVLALIDDGETDWKVIAIAETDPLAPLLNDVADVEAHIPGCITAVHDWLRDYKAPKINEYGFDGQCMDRAFAEAAIAETHEFWEKLVAEKGGRAVVD